MSTVAAAELETQYHALAATLSEIALPVEAQVMLSAGVPRGYVFALYKPTAAEAQRQLVTMLHHDREVDEAHGLLQLCHWRARAQLVNAVEIRRLPRRHGVPTVPIKTIRQAVCQRDQIADCQEAYENLQAMVHLFSAIGSLRVYEISTPLMATAIRAYEIWQALLTYTPAQDRTPLDV